MLGLEKKNLDESDVGMRSILNGNLLIGIILMIVAGCDGTNETIAKYPSGKIKSKTSTLTENGVTINSGPLFEYFESGTIRVKGYFKANKKDSVWSEFDE